MPVTHINENSIAIKYLSKVNSRNIVAYRAEKVWHTFGLRIRSLVWFSYYESADGSNFVLSPGDTSRAFKSLISIEQLRFTRCTNNSSLKFLRNATTLFPRRNRDGKKWCFLIGTIISLISAFIKFVNFSFASNRYNNFLQRVFYLI